MEISKETPVGAPMGTEGVLKTCRACLQAKPAEHYTKHPSTRDRLQPNCRPCVSLRAKAARKPRAEAAQARYKAMPRERLLWKRARSRALAAKRTFTITVTDINIPEVRPVFGIPFGPTGSPYAPSLDRKDSAKGYTPDNITVISLRANLLKKDATPEEIAKLHQFMQTLA